MSKFIIRRSLPPAVLQNCDTKTIDNCQETAVLVKKDIARISILIAQIPHLFPQAVTGEGASNSQVIWGVMI